MTYRIHRFITVVVLLLLVCGCREEEPSTSLSDARMSRIMADLFIAEAATTGMSGFAKDSLTHVYYDQVFRINGTTLEEYEKNMRILVREETRIEQVVKDAIDLLRTEKAADEQPE